MDNKLKNRYYKATMSVIDLAVMLLPKCTLGTEAGICCRTLWEQTHIVWPTASLQLELKKMLQSLHPGKKKLTLYVGVTVKRIILFIIKKNFSWSKINFQNEKLVHKSRTVATK